MPNPNTPTPQRHQPKPHKAKHQMTPSWKAASEKVAAKIPGAASGDENDGVQRMFDYMKDAPKNPDARFYASADAYADSSVHFAALARSMKVSAAEGIAMATHLLNETIAATAPLIQPAIETGEGL
jgi:hypothetical protein